MFSRLAWIRSLIHKRITKKYPDYISTELGVVCKPSQLSYYPVGTIERAEVLKIAKIEYTSPDGRLLSKEEYPELYNLIKDKFSRSDDDPKMFRIPDLHGNVVRKDGNSI